MLGDKKDERYSAFTLSMYIVTNTVKMVREYMEIEGLKDTELHMSLASIQRAVEAAKYRAELLRRGKS